MNPLPMVFAAGAVCCAIKGYDVTMLLMWFGAAGFALLDNAAKWKLLEKVLKK